MGHRNLNLLHLSIITFCLWESLSLFEAWFVSPYDAFNWIPFILWLLPLYALRLPTSWVASELALVMVIAGILTAVNTLTYIGFAFSIAAWIPWSKESPLWISSSILWMPIFSYLMVEWPFGIAISCKVLGVSLATLLKIRSLRNEV
ncbi:MAG: hypothetical protein WC222_07925 [Parachlamydiales bacterium]